MGMIWPLIVFVMFLGLNAVTAYRSKQLSQPVQQSAAIANGQNFIRYRDALTNFATANPGFTGVVPISNLLPFLYGWNAVAFSNMSNVISSLPSGGRQVASYQTNGRGAASALAQSGYDASIGRTDSAGNWSSYANPFSTSPIPTTVKNCGLVSILTTN